MRKKVWNMKMFSHLHVLPVPNYPLNRLSKIKLIRLENKPAEANWQNNLSYSSHLRTHTRHRYQTTP
jgi:hypothetical protein